MNPDALARCRDYLDRLAQQIDTVLPAAPQGYGYQAAPLPPERLPLVASLVRDYVEAEVMLAGATAPDDPAAPPDERTND